ncbi:MAG: sigma-70 family RNA polymerase sigma factor [Ignavibacteria bacterium]|nr:sigma-70 family RNA polymerase sigma factor [Ignavibacteria bacterium]
MNSSKPPKEIEKNIIFRESSHPDPDYTEIQKIQTGDMQAFRNIVEKYQEKVRNLTYSVLGEKTHVDDVAQEVFTKVYLKSNSFRFEAKFSTWLYQITLNKCRDELRKKTAKSFFLIKNAENIQTHDQTTELIESTNLSELVREQIAKLPRKLREVVILKDINDLSYKEISNVLNCNEGTVKSRLFRGRMELKNRLTPFRKELGF